MKTFAPNKGLIHYTRFCLTDETIAPLSNSTPRMRNYEAVNGARRYTIKQIATTCPSGIEIRPVRHVVFIYNLFNIIICEEKWHV